MVFIIPFILVCHLPHVYIGRMDNIQILTDPNNKSSKYAMVTFSNPASATKAVQGVNQTKLGNRTITANLVSQ